jgi:hypothetical protein
MHSDIDEEMLLRVIKRLEARYRPPIDRNSPTVTSNVERVIRELSWDEWGASVRELQSG